MDPRKHKTDRRDYYKSRRTKIAVKEVLGSVNLSERIQACLIRSASTRQVTEVKRDLHRILTTLSQLPPRRERRSPTPDEDARHQVEEVPLVHIF